MLCGPDLEAGRWLSPPARARRAFICPPFTLNQQTLFFNVFDSPAELFDEPIFITVYHQMMFFFLLKLLGMFWSHLTSGAELIRFAKAFH